MAEPTAPLKIKKAGIIRWSAIGPLVLILGGLSVYGVLFLDHHLRWGLEWGLTRANGAQVDVGHLSTSLWRMELEIRAIEATDKTTPSRNGWALDRVYWKLSGDALLRGKLVIEESSITGIALNSARKKPGRVLPPPPPAPEQGPSWMDQLKGEAKERLTQEVNSDPFAQTVQTLANTQDPVALAKSQLRSLSEVEKVSKSLQDSEQRWRQSLSQLPTAQSIKDLETRINNVQIPSDAKDLPKIQATVKELQSLAAEGSKVTEQVQKLSQNLDGDLKTFQSQLNELDRLIKADMQAVTAGGGLALDPKSLGKDVFQRTVGERLNQAQDLINFSRRYMPAASNEKAPSRLEPRERAQGVTYQFGRPNSYPLFWWKRAVISSSGAAGMTDLKGTMTDLTTDPPQVGRPFMLKLEGSLPEAGVRGAEVLLTIDHVTRVAKESLAVTVASVNLTERPLLPDPPVALHLRAGQLRTKTTLQAEGQAVTLTSENLLSQTKFEVQTQPELVQSALSRAFGELAPVTLNARMSGTWDTFRLGVDSNLGEQLQRNLSRQLQEQLDKARAQVQAYIDKEIRPKQRQVQEQYTKIQGDIQRVLGTTKTAAEQPQRLAENKIRDSQNRAAVPAEAQKAVDDLKKRFKF